MRLRHWIVAGTALVSATALAGGDKQRQTQNEPQSQTSAAASSPQQSHSQQSQSQPGEQRQQSGASQSQEVVKQAQEKLSQLGHDAGPADGVVGPKTQAAVKEFQQSKGLNESGQLDSQTLAALQVGESRSSASTDRSSSAGGDSATSMQSGGTSGSQKQ